MKFQACRKPCRFEGLLKISLGVSWRFGLKNVAAGKNRSGHTEYIFYLIIVVKIYMLVVRNYLSDWGRHCAWQVGELFFESWQNAASDIAQKGRVDVSKLDVDVGRVLEEG